MDLLNMMKMSNNLQSASKWIVVMYAIIIVALIVLNFMILGGLDRNTAFLSTGAIVAGMTLFYGLYRYQFGEAIYLATEVDIDRVAASAVRSVAAPLIQQPAPQPVPQYGTMMQSQPTVPPQITNNAMNTLNQAAATGQAYANMGRQIANTNRNYMNAAQNMFNQYRSQ